MIYIVEFPLARIFSKEIQGGLTLWCREQLGKENEIKIDRDGTLPAHLEDGQWWIVFQPENEPPWGYFKLGTDNQQVALLAKLIWS